MDGMHLAPIGFVFENRHISQLKNNLPGWTFFFFEQKTRLTILSDEQKQQVADMTKPSDIEYSERKRQYSALRRAIIKDANPALIAKFSLASDGERLLA